MNVREIGTIIRVRREILGVDQRDLSQIAGISVHTLSNIEAGSRNPTVKSLEKILAALGMELIVDIQRQE